MKVKKFISGILCASILLSSMTAVLATEQTSTDSWNYSLVTESTKDLYADFPMHITKSIGQEMSLSIQFQYLKNISVNDTVEVTITDLSNNSVIGNYQLTSSNSFIIWGDVANDKNYSVSITENLNGNQETYTGYINTKFTQTDFPVNITLGDKTYNYNQGEEFSTVSYKKVGERATCTHDENEDCTSACSIASVLQTVDENGLNSFYDTLDADSYYELQVKATKEGRTEYHQGFISTYPDGEDLGVFTRGYEFSTENPMEVTAQTFVLPRNGNQVATTSSAPQASDYDFSTAFIYEYYENEMGSGLDVDTDLIVKWTVPETGTYTVETIGNLDTQWYRFSVKSTTGEIYPEGEAKYSGGSGENVGETISILQGQVRYYVLNLEPGVNNTSGKFGFRITKNSLTDTDGISGYRDVVQANCDAGIFSSATNPDCYIEDDGDVDIFAYNVTKGFGNLVFEDVETPLSVKVYSVSGRTDGFDDLWTEGTIAISKQDAAQISQLEFDAGIHYVDVKQQTVATPGSSGDFATNFYAYSFDFYDPKHKDAVDSAGHSRYGNNAPHYATDITDLLPYQNSSLTLHRGDADYFIFETGDEGGDIEINVTAAQGITTYIPHLYAYESVILGGDADSPSWNITGELGTYVSVDSQHNKLTYEGLTPGEKYYVHIASTGNTSTAYSSYYPYTLSIDVTTPEVPTATLSGNVSLSHTSGSDITSLDAFKSQVMSQLTCYINGVEVNDTTAVDDVKLFYNDTELTVTTVNSLTAGTYTLTAKYMDATATGGTIILTVSTPVVGTIVELSNVSIESVALVQNRDWLSCAKAAANVELTRLGLPTSTKSLVDAQTALRPNGGTGRGTISETVSAAQYFLLNGASSTTTYFESLEITPDLSSAVEEFFLDRLQQGQAIIIALTSNTNPTNMANARYVLVCGINTGTHQLKILDPVKSSLNGYHSLDELLNGGYNNNSDLRFTGTVIEASSLQ